MKIGTKGFWIDDNEPCEIIGIEDEGAGMYVFQSLIPGPLKPATEHIWIGYIEDFSPEV